MNHVEENEHVSIENTRQVGYQCSCALEADWDQGKTEQD
jgi:hypothetical protein